MVSCSKFILASSSMMLASAQSSTDSSPSASSSSSSSSSSSDSSSSDSTDVCSKFLNASSQADLDKIAGCPKFDASLSITTDGGVLTLNGVQNITGSLSIVESSDLTSFSAPTLKRVDGTLDLEGLTILNTLSMPQLTDLGGLKFVTLPALEELQFNTGVQNARNILISDTALKSLEGLNLTDVDNFQVNNNKNIDEIAVKASQISQALDISFNAAKVNVSLPNLQWVNNATFRYCSSVDMPNLEKVNQSLGFVNNTLYSLQFDKLASVGALTISSNSELRNASFSNLTAINGGFVIANNSHYGKIMGFPKLKTVRGAIQFEGNMTQASLPSLDEVDGGVQVSSDNVFNCSSFDDAHANGDFHGDKYVCKGKSTTISTTLQPTSVSTAAGANGAAASDGATSAASSGDSSSAKSSSAKSSKSSKSKNDAAPLAAAGTGLVGSLVAVLFQFI